MKRTLALAALLSLLALASPAPYGTREAVATQPDKCVKCQAKAGEDLEKCEARNGGPSQFCYDQFNSDIVVCYATVCEQ